MDALRRQPAPTVALDGCNIVRPDGFDGGVELAFAQPGITRAFPLHVSTGLGVCLKLGAAHAVTSNGRRQTYPADALCVRAPGCVWSCEAAPVGFFSIDIAPRLLPSDLAPHDMRFLSAARGLDLRLLSARLCAADALLREQSLVELVLTLVEHGGVNGARSTTDLAPVARARERLRADLGNTLSLDQLAREVGVNKFVLIRRFRAETGTTPHRYRTLVRVERAREQLARGTPLIEVAHALGFADQAHFSRTFKRVMGLGPRRYLSTIRRQHAGVGAAKFWGG
ncbi:MAG: AraC family transcriptional regulator [Polyangiales bacterium]